MKKKLLIILLIVLIAIQFIPVDFTNPGVEANNEFIAMTQPPANVEKMLRSACYDCHSNETVYPWYSKIAPVNFWLKQHINEGRHHLNYSEWGTYDAKKRDHKLEEMAEVVNEGEMPLTSYTWAHGDAKLNEAQKDSLVNWFNSLR